MGRCEKCLFWGQIRDDWGQCELLSTREGRTYCEDLLAYAIDTDPDGIAKNGARNALFKCNANFGCAEFEAKSRRKKISDSTRYRLLKQANFRCQACGSSASEVPLEIDHVVPFSASGADEEFNYQVLCRRCNQGKGASL